jgi:hypothetical protein
VRIAVRLDESSQLELSRVGQCCGSEGASQHGEEICQDRVLHSRNSNPQGTGLKV